MTTDHDLLDPITEDLRQLAALAAPAVYLMDDPRVPQFEQLFSRALAEISTSEDGAKFGGSSLVMRLA